MNLEPLTLLSILSFMKLTEKEIFEYFQENEIVIKYGKHFWQTEFDKSVVW